MSESWPDQVSRLHLMAKDEKWDLSPKDRAAISAALALLSKQAYCDVCGREDGDLRTPVEVCRDCYDLAKDPPPGTGPLCPRCHGYGSVATSEGTADCPCGARP